MAQIYFLCRSMHEGEDFAINSVCSKFFSLLLTGKILRGVTERVGLKKYL